jgi:chromosome segregation ATPase
VTGVQTCALPICVAADTSTYRDQIEQLTTKIQTLEQASTTLTESRATVAKLLYATKRSVTASKDKITQLTEELNRERIDRRHAQQENETLKDTIAEMRRQASTPSGPTARRDPNDASTAQRNVAPSLSPQAITDEMLTEMMNTTG